VTASINTSSAALAERLETNRKYSAVDFQDWLMQRLAVRPGADVLDVGCGTGAQTLAFLSAVGPRGSVSALDLSPESIATVRTRAGAAPNLQGEVADMMDVAEVVARRFRVKRFDLAQSTYALYYATRPVGVLDAMRRVLKPGGRIAVCTPNNPHGLIEFIRRFTEVPAANDANGRFGPDVLEPYFRRHFFVVDIALLCNVQRVPTVDEVMRFWRNTSYYDSAVADRVATAVEDEISRRGGFFYEKNSYLIVGSVPRPDANEEA